MKTLLQWTKYFGGEIFGVISILVVGFLVVLAYLLIFLIFRVPIPIAG